MRSTRPVSTTHRRRWLWVAPAAAWVLPAATMAWACVVVASTRMSPSSGPAGTAVTVTGSDWPTDRPVEIRWGSTTGPLLGTGSGPNFSTTVHIPDADPGDHNVVARATFDNGSTAAQQSMTFRVTAPAPATTTTTVPPPATTTTTVVAEQAPAPTPWPYQATGTAAEPAAAGTQPGMQPSSAGPSGAATRVAPVPAGATPPAVRGVSPAHEAPPPAPASSGAAPGPIAAGAVVTPAVDVAENVAAAAPTAAAAERRLAAGTPAALRGLPEHDDSSPSPILLVGAVVLAATTIAGLVVRARLRL